MFEFKTFEVFNNQKFRLSGMTDFKNENNAEIGYYGQTLIRTQMKENVIKEKSLKFAIRIVKLYQYFVEEKKEFVISKQLLRSGIGIGANIREGDYAESKSDFIHKFAIAQKECNETLYWIELLYSTNYLSETEYESINKDAIELIKLLTSIIKTSKNIIKH